MSALRITTEAVEAAADAYLLTKPTDRLDWRLDKMRAALEAALPLLASVDREALEEVMDREICTCQSCEEESGYNEGARAVQKAVLALLNGEVTS